MTKRKILKGLLAIVTTSLAVVSFSACGATETTPQNDCPPHSYATTWSKDENYHWHASTCGHDVTSDKLLHTWDSGVVTKPASCVEDGIVQYLCITCGAEKQATLTATGHSESYISHNECSKCHETSRSKATNVGTLQDISYTVGNKYAYFFYYVGDIEHVVLEAGSISTYPAGTTKELTLSTKLTKTETVETALKTHVEVTVSDEYSAGGGIDSISLGVKKSFTLNAGIDTEFKVATENASEYVNSQKTTFTLKEVGNYRSICEATMEVYCMVSYDVKTGEISCSDFIYNIVSTAYKWDYTTFSVFKNSESKLNFDFDKEYIENYVNDIGTGTQKSPYKISTTDDLKLLSTNYSDCFILMNDIDLQGATWNAVSAFSGTLDGNNKKIYNFNCSVGFIVNLTATGTIKNLTIGDANSNNYDGYSVKITSTQNDGRKDIAGLVCLNYGTIENCNIVNVYVSGTVKKEHSGRTYVKAGGVVATNNGTIKNCSVEGCYISGAATYNSANYQNSYSSVGGICGSAESGYISYCKSINNTVWAIAQTKGFGTDEANAYVYCGGLVGEHGSGASLTNSIVQNNIIKTEGSYQDNKGSLYIKAGEISGSTNGIISDCTSD